MLPSLRPVGAAAIRTSKVSFFTGYTGNKSAENISSVGGSDLGTDAPVSSGMYSSVVIW